MLRLLSLVLITAGCPAIFNTDHVPRARPGETFDVELDLVPVYGDTDTPIACIELPIGWTVGSVAYSGTVQSRTMNISGNATLDPNATTNMEMSDDRPGVAWSCYAGINDYYDTIDSGSVVFAVQPAVDTGTFELRVAAGAVVGGLPFFAPVGRRITLGDLNDPFDDWISATDYGLPPLYGVAYGNGTWVAVTPDLTSVVSTDAATWTSTPTLPLLPRRVRYVGGLFVAVGESLATATSTDGIVWNLPNISGGSPPPTLNDVAFGNGLFVAPRDDGWVQYSSDAETWTATSTPSLYALRAITYGASMFVAVGAGGVIVRSPDAITWTSTSLPSLSTLQAIAYGNGLFVAAGQSDTIYTSVDGETWAPNVVAGLNTVEDLVFGGGTFAALSSANGRVFTTQDGVSWAPHDLGTQTYPAGIAYGADQLVVVAYEGYIGRSPIPRASADGPFDLGDVDLTAPETATWTVTSLGPGRLALGQAVLVGSPGFSLGGDGCTGATLSPNAPCTIDVVFAPPSRGPTTAALTLPTNDPDQPSLSTSVAAVGVGTAPDISIDPASHDFGVVTVGAVAIPVSVTVTNRGDADLTISSITTAPPFSVTSDLCSAQTVPPTGTCTFLVLLTPAVVGAANGTVDVASNDPDSPLATVLVTGEGGEAAVPNIAVTDSIAPPGDRALPFAAITPGATARATVTVTNAGNAELAVGAVAGAEAPFSVASDTCSSRSLAPLASCTFDVVFAPAVEGTSSGDITIASNDPDAPNVTVSYNGTALAKAQCTSSPPAAPVLVSPENNATGVAIPAKVSWNDSTDPDGDPISYDVFVCQASDFSGCDPIMVSMHPSALLLLLAGTRPRIAVGLLSLAACPNQADQEREVPGLEPNTRYFWKVRAKDNTGCFADSEVRSFTTAL